MRIEVLTTSGSGAVLGYAIASYKGKQTGENALLRQLVGQLKAGDIFLGDAIFENYFLLAFLQIEGIDAVCEKNGARHVDFRQCDQKLGKKDGLIRLTKPPRPEWMSREYYDRWVPGELTIRVVKNKKRIIVTTLLDAEKYPRSEIISLYLARWHVELDLRSIKSLMKMDVLRCKTPEMVRKEITVHLLVYNLIRALMARAATELKNQPREISFKAAQETLQEFHVLLLQAETALLSKMVKHMVQIASEHVVRNRPGRSEPRAVKRRPKPYKRLQHPRSQARRLKVYQRKAA
ncbi:IS4 family transposase [Endozoicomonas numazuensis]|uniref:IS4 family transposase n=1 Tax=Endozoicomonas numazuensis TaxID=1137799 RepID=UPI0009DCC85C|nr:IS4 family transposase [Endozoicomonas numazuensis]